MVHLVGFYHKNWTCN